MKLNKRILTSLLAATMAVTIFAGCGGGDTPQSEASSDSGKTAGGGDKVKLTIWDWDEAHLKHMPEFYQKSHPDVEFETLLVPANDYMQKFQSALASGTDVPDVVLTELAYRGRLFDLGVLEDLSSDPYNVTRSDMFDFAVDFGTGPNGELLGVEQQICPTGFAYRRDLAKEYLGTDDPAQLAEMIPDWDTFIEKGKEVAEKSGGSVVIFPSVSSIIGVLRYQNPFGYIEDNKINLTERYQNLFDMATKMNQSGILGNMEEGSPALNAGFAEGKFIFYQCAPWAMKWSIEANDPKGSGRWGLVKAPSGGFTNGGTSVSIYSDSKNKDAAWEYIRYTYCDGDGVEEAYKQFGFMTGFKAPYEDENSYFFTEKGVYDDFFGGQQMTDYFINQISLELKGQPQTKNESAVTTALNAVVPQIANDKSIDSAKALELLKQEVLALVPDAEIQ